MKLVIVGGVAGGASAATRARRLSESAEIVLIERGPDVSFANCGLPYYLGGEITERDKLLVTLPQQLRQRFNLDVRTRTEAVRIDRGQKELLLRDLATGREYREKYDKLILAPGAAPLRPPLPGLDLPGVFTLRTLADMDRIKEAMTAGVRRAVIVGAGFIGLELAEAFVHRGIATTVVELQNQALPPFDQEMTAAITAELQKNGVDLLLGESAAGFSSADFGLDVTLKSGRKVPASLVVLGIGVRPENQLATEAGLEVGPRGGIRVNEHLQTSDLDIYAAGDAVETRDFVTGERVQVPLGGPANRQGRLAADHIFGRSTVFRGVQATAVVRVFGLTAALTGASEKTLRRLNRPFMKVNLHPFSHATYFPGARQFTLKLLYEPGTGKILGAQAVGGEGVDKRIDVLSVMIQGGMTVFDLEQAELCYAPPYGSAKDPLNMAGFVAAGRLRGDHPQLAMDELTPELLARSLVLDVRTPAEFSQGHLPGAVNMPIDELRQRLSELPRDRKLLAYCRVGQRGYLATRILMQAGFDVANLSGGWLTWRQFHPN